MIHTWLMGAHDGLSRYDSWALSNALLGSRYGNNYIQGQDYLVQKFGICSRLVAPWRENVPRRSWRSNYSTIIIESMSVRNIRFPIHIDAVLPNLTIRASEYRIVRLSLRAVGIWLGGHMREMQGSKHQQGDLSQTSPPLDLSYFVGTRKLRYALRHSKSHGRFLSRKAYPTLHDRCVTAVRYTSPSTLC